MTKVQCPGLDATNPLHMLAALGLLRLADRIVAGARLGFARQSGAWNPAIEVEMAEEDLLGQIAAWLGALGRTEKEDPALPRKVRDLAAREKRTRDALKEAQKAARLEAKAGKLGKAETERAVAEAGAVLERELRSVRGDLAGARSALATANGMGIAHLGDIIGVDQAVFRDFGMTALDGLLSTPGEDAGAETASSVDAAAGQPADELAPSTPLQQPGDPVLVSALLAAVACDQVLEGGKVKPTPYSFGNGASGQCLLKSFRACAALVDRTRIGATLRGEDGRLEEGESLTLNWDPADLRSYALAWKDPAGVTKKVDVAANALAYVGLGLLPCFPTRRGLGAVGWGRDDAWTWPLWEPPLSLPVVASLLGDVALQGERPDRAGLARRGVAEVRRCQRLNTGKRFFFAPSRPC